MKKMNISTEKTVTLIFFQSKLGGPTEKQGTQKKDRLGWARGIVLSSCGLYENKFCLCLCLQACQSRTKSQLQHGAAARRAECRKCRLLLQRCR
jgi:hypothetical protein